MSQVVTIDGVSLLIYCFHEKPVIEAYELARALGYQKQSSIRRQILTRWKDCLSPSSYQLVHDVQALRAYEDEYTLMLLDTIKPMKPERGRLFLTPVGVARVLSLTTKKKKYPVGDALKEAGFLDDIPIDPANYDYVKELETAQAIEGLTNLRRDLVTVRQHNYDVLQKLLTQLQELEDRDLILLAIEAAEIALGRQLPNLRNKYSMAPDPGKPESKPSPTGSTKGPLFKKPGLYTMTEIGEMAGGYTAKSAGLAVDLVGRRWGHTHHHLRNTQLPFNKIEERPDSTTGKRRRMCRFNREFANEVVRELRRNPQFLPRENVLPLSSFGGGGASQPNLSQGLFSDEDDPATH